MLPVSEARHEKGGGVANPVYHERFIRYLISNVVHHSRHVLVCHFHRRFGPGMVIERVYPLQPNLERVGLATLGISKVRLCIPGFVYLGRGTREGGKRIDGSRVIGGGAGHFSIACLYFYLQLTIGIDRASPRERNTINSVAISRTISDGQLLMPCLPNTGTMLYNIIGGYGAKGNHM